MLDDRFDQVRIHAGAAAGYAASGRGQRNHDWAIDAGGRCMNMRRRSRRDARDAEFEADLTLTMVKCDAGRTTAIGIAAAYLGRPGECRCKWPAPMSGS